MHNRRDRLLLGLALLLALSSLGLNLVFFWQMNRMRTSARLAVDQGIASLDELYASDLRYDYHLKETIPFKGSIPVREDLLFPIKTEVIIDTTIPVTVFNVALSVPIHTTVPISTQVPVNVDTSVPVSLTLPLDLKIPIALSVKDSPLDGILQRIRERLTRLREGL